MSDIGGFAGITIIIAIIHYSSIFGYLGFTFADDKKDLDWNDWRRKWIIFFAYFTIAFYGFGGLMSFFENKYYPLISIPFIVNSIICLSYLGGTFNETKIKGDDWRRKYIIFFTWLEIASVVVFLFINLSFLEKELQKEKASEREKLLQHSRTPRPYVQTSSPYVPTSDLRSWADFE